MYEAFSKKEKDGVIAALTETSEVQQPKKTFHIFQSLQYLYKLCSHPLLVLDHKQAEFSSITQDLKKLNMSLYDFDQSPKLVALKQLFHQCGIGLDTKDEIGKHNLNLFQLMTSTFFSL